MIDIRAYMFKEVPEMYKNKYTVADFNKVWNLVGVLFVLGILDE